MSGTLFTESEPMSTEANALAVHETNPLAIIQTALASGAAPEQLEKLMELQERWERNRAAEAYAHALTKFQAKCPRVKKRREATISGDRGSYKYSYAGYDDLMAEVGDLLSECGLALSFSTQNQEKGIRVILRIRHGTHCEEHTLDVPVPAMKVNDTQRYGAALSYAKRYAMCAALNIVVTDEDNDASECYDAITEEQENELGVLVGELVNRFGEEEKRRFLKYMGVDLIANISAADFARAKEAARNKLSHANR